MNSLQKDIYENRLCKMAELEMQCYCEKHECINTIDYMNHHDWGRSEDYLCEDCLNNCEEN
jgi:hypothetical protein